MGFLICCTGIPEPQLRINKVHDFFIPVMEQEKVHIGRMIQEELRRQGRTVTWFAQNLPCDRSNAYKMFRNETIDLSQLIRISKMLDHDFLKQCSDHLGLQK